MFAFLSQYVNCVVKIISAFRRFQQVCHRHETLIAHHSVVHEVHAGQFEFLLASVETVDGIVAVGGVGQEDEVGELTTQVLAWCTAGTCQTATQPAVKLHAVLRASDASVLEIRLDSCL